MATKKNLPNIPLYIGDWEKDCNVLSLETEAAWLRIIFKMFTNGKQSTYKIPTKGLQNLWRVSEEKAQEIIEELLDYNICEIAFEGRFVEFTSRRFQKENEISEIRKEAVSNRKDRTKSNQTTYKPPTKDIQNTEIDIENENEIKNEKKGKGVKGEKPKEISIPDSDEIIKSDIFKKCQKFFSQTTQELKMRMFGDFRRIEKSGMLKEFEAQTLAYIEYKTISKEIKHRWQNYAYEWKNENWIDLLADLKTSTKQEKAGMNAKGKTTKDFLNV